MAVPDPSGQPAQAALAFPSPSPSEPRQVPILAGAASWSERSLVRDGDWYPRRTMTAAQRIAHYAGRLPVVEIDSTYRFPPTPEVCQQWVDRTPEGFTIDVVAWSLFTGNATLPDSLWPDLLDEVRPEMRDRRRLYANHLSDRATAECWRRFRHAIEPLHRAHRLGGVMLRYPHWLRPGETGRGLLRQARLGLGDLPAAVDLRHPQWLQDGQCEATLGFLEDHDLGLVCLDTPDALEREPVVAATADLAVVRFEGRHPGRWEDPDMPWAERFAYRYSDDDLRPWVPRLHELAASAPAVHAIFANTWRDDAVDGAARLASLLGQEVTIGGSHRSGG